MKQFNVDNFFASYAFKGRLPESQPKDSDKIRSLAIAIRINVLSRKNMTGCSMSCNVHKKSIYRVLMENKGKGKLQKTTK